MRRTIAAAAIVAVSFASYTAGAQTTSEGPLFNGTETATRCGVVTMLWRAEGTPTVTASHGFIDHVPDWCEPALRWATATGITEGVGWGVYPPDP